MRGLPTCYEKIRPEERMEKLPAGSCILKIKKVHCEEGKNRYLNVIVLTFDIAEGEWAGYFHKTYEADIRKDKKWGGIYRLYVPKDTGNGLEDWIWRQFKTGIDSFEDSNPGFIWNWKEEELIGKEVGGLLGGRECKSDGGSVFLIGCYGLCSVEKIRRRACLMPGSLV